MLKKNLANMITSTRILCSIVLFFVDIKNKIFLILYSLTGLTDVLDGFVARSMKIESKLGSILDSIADYFFYIMMFTKIFPYLMDNLNLMTWIVIFVIILIRIFSYIYVAINKKAFMSNHTILNKLTGLALFLLPYSIIASLFKYHAFITILIAFAAALYELSLINFKKEKQ